MSTKFILSLLGIKKGKIGRKLFELAFNFGAGAIEDEVFDAIHTRMTATRRAQVAEQLEAIADSLRVGNDSRAARQVVQLLEEIKP
jgi:hypothetical protein